MAATTPRTPVAPGMIIGWAALDEELALVPEVLVPSPGSVEPVQVNVPLIASVLPAWPWKLVHAAEMSPVDRRVKAPRTSLMAGRSTLQYC